MRDYLSLLQIYLTSYSIEQQRTKWTTFEPQGVETNTNMYSLMHSGTFLLKTSLEHSVKKSHIVRSLNNTRRKRRQCDMQRQRCFDLNIFANRSTRRFTGQPPDNRHRTSQDVSSMFWLGKAVFSDLLHVRIVVIKQYLIFISCR